MKAPYDSYDYVGYWQGREYEDACERIALGEFLKTIGPGRSVIDIGGGFGRLTPLYIPFFQKVTVLDPSAKNLEIGRHELKAYPQVSLVQGGLPKLPFKDKSFDAVFLIRVSHHLPDLLPTLNEIARLLDGGGFLVLEVANKVHFLARLRAFFSGDFSFAGSEEPLERRSAKAISEEAIAFSNHHPGRVLTELEQSGFKVKKILSVSNFRHPWLKKILPLKLALFLEKNLQTALGPFYFGPSLFILAQKAN